MKILLKEDVENLGAVGDIVTVADGYARNYLIPKELAVKATPGQVKQIDVIRRQAYLKRERVVAYMAAMTERLNGILLTFEANASERGRLYGSITKDDIVEALEFELGEPVDRRKVETGPLRQVGLHTIPIRLSGEMIPEIRVIVHREGEDPSSYLPVVEEPADEEPAAEGESKAGEILVEAEAEVEVETETEAEAEEIPAEA